MIVTKGSLLKLFYCSLRYLPSFNNSPSPSQQHHLNLSSLPGLLSDLFNDFEEIVRTCTIHALSDPNAAEKDALDDKHLTDENEESAHFPIGLD
jgi:hypothetical protein